MVLPMFDARLTGSAIGGFLPAEPEGSTRRRVLMVTHDFPPSLTMAGETCAQIARYLPLYGWDPIVLTARDPDAGDQDASSGGLLPRTVIRTGAIPHPFTIYKRLKTYKRLTTRSRSRSDGAAGGQAGSRTSGLLRRWVLSLLQVPDVYSGWIPPAVIAGLGAIRRHGVEHLFSASPHSSGHLVGLALARLSGLPWTAQFQDPWTYPPAQWEEAKLVSAASVRLETALERMVLRRADAVVCVTDRHTAWLRGAHPDVRAGKFVTILNGFDSIEWERVDEETARSQPASKDTFVITYAGTLYLRRSPLPLFRALRSLIDSGDVVPERVRVDLLGQCDVADGIDVTSMAAACGLTGCVRVTGPLGRAEALRRVAQSDLLLLLAEGLTQQIPGKAYEYLRAGRPILALTSEGAVADLLRLTGGAWVVDPADQTNVTAAVLEAYRLWRNGRPGPRPDPRVVAGFDRRVLSGGFAGLFNRALAGSGGRAKPGRPVTASG